MSDADKQSELASYVSGKEQDVRVLDAVFGDVRETMQQKAAQMAKRELNDEQRAALRKVVLLQVQLWNAGSAAEELLDVDVQTSGDSLDHLCVGLKDEADVENLSDEELMFLLADDE